MRRARTLTLAAVGLAAIAAAPAGAHQTAFGNGVAVTVHVAPGDAPPAGRRVTVNIAAVVAPKGGRWSFRTGRPTLRITDSAGKAIRRGRTGRRPQVTFPRPGAYQ